MKKFVRSETYFLFFLVWMYLIVPQSAIIAQESCTGEGKLEMEVTLSPTLENAQVLGLTNLGVDSKGAGPLLASVIFRNLTDELLTNLFFEFQFNAGRIGLIADITQRAAYPFTLDPMQVVYATNNDIQNEMLPGVDESMRFDGGLTPEGEDFLENLDGTTLPSDIYTLSAKIFQVTNACGKIELASYIGELGGGASGAVVDERSIFLRTPGDVVGTEVAITNQFPQFSWEGDATLDYRVIVVKQVGQESPESLISSAFSSSPTNEGGSLLQNENLDIIVQGTSLQFPSSGVQALEIGQKYYWQVTTEIQTASDTEDVVSEIWSFNLASPGDESAAAAVEIDQDIIETLIFLVGQEEYTTLLGDGFYFEGLIMDGQQFSGIAGIQKLAEIVLKIEDGDIIVGSN